MNKSAIFKIALPLIIFLFFLTPSFAYSEFLYNPYFTNNVDGITIYNQINQTISWNTTCSGLSSCLLVTSNGSSSVVNVYQNNPLYNPLINPQQTDNVTLVTYCYGSNCSYALAMPTLPPNKEGLLVLNYRWNNTVLSAKLYLVQLVLGYPANPESYNLTINQNLNITPNIWHNLSFVIPSLTNWYRTYALFVQYVTDSVPTQLAMDKFKFYTLDLEEGRIDWTTDATYERNRYCGNNSIFQCAGETEPRYFLIARNGTTGILLANDSENFWCEAYKLGNITIVRRAIIQEGTTISSCTAQIHVLNDNSKFIIGYPIGYGGSCGWFEESHSLAQAKVTFLYNHDGINENCTGTEKYNNVPATNISWLYTWTPTNQQAIRQTINLNTTSLPAGSQWKLCFVGGCSVSNSSWYNFFTASLSCSDIAGLYCDQNYNQQYYVFSDCSVSTPQYCSNWYCKQNLLKGYGCNFGTVGSWCLDDCTYIIFNSDGSSQTGYTNCPLYQCYNITYPNGTVDYSIYNTSEIQDLINQGYNVTDHNIIVTNSTQTIAIGHFFDFPTLACNFGSQTGLGCEGSKFLIGLFAIILIIGSLNGFDYIMTKDHKFLPTELNILLTVLVIGGFSFYIPLINPLLFVAIVIISALLLARHFSAKQTGGT